MALPLLPWLLPVRCPGCGAAATSLCDDCWRRLRAAPPAAPPPGVDRCRSLLAYDGPGRAIVVRLKYGNERALLRWLAAGMAALVRASVAEEGVSVVTWAPTDARRRRARGFDQAELLARGVARELDLPCRKLLIRLPGPPQTGRGRDERGRGPGFRPASGPLSRAVLVVDDVRTTGATASAAALALRRGGVERVIVVTSAATPLKADRARADA